MAHGQIARVEVAARERLPCRLRLAVVAPGTDQTRSSTRKGPTS